MIDSGCGISATALPRLFEPFNPLDNLTTRAQGGLGVGLALVKDLVELHGGHVTADSAGIRRGATFTVLLPLGGRSQSSPAPTAATGELQRPLEGIRVLIVDDDHDIGEVLQFVLEAQGALVSVAHSAAEALSFLTRSMPDVLLSDLAMPGGSGYDLMRHIVAREGEQAPPAGGAIGVRSRARSRGGPGRWLPHAAGKADRLRNTDQGRLQLGRRRAQPQPEPSTRGASAR